MNTEHSLIRELKSQSTWRLFGLGFITFGVYFAHYIQRQTDIINKYCEEDDEISDVLVTMILVLSYVSILFFFAGIISREGSQILEEIQNLIDTVANIFFIVWGFKARNRVHQILEIRKYSYSWFSGLWTFLFTPLYFNYKVNELNEECETH